MSIKTTVITGATSGIGKETALALAKMDHAIYMLVRNIEKGEQVKQEIIKETGNQSIYVIKCDLANMQTVSAAAHELNQKLFNINVLINNAGGMFPTRELSKDGFEMSLAANHLGHFLLTTSLFPLLARGHARVINVSSEAHKWGRPDFNDLQMEHSYSATKAYGNAKLFNIYFTKSLAVKYADKGITAYSLHPGLVKTNFGNDAKGIFKLIMWMARPFMVTVKEGAKTLIYLATEAKIKGKTGDYFIKSKVAKSSSLTDDVISRNRLWEISEELIMK